MRRKNSQTILAAALVAMGLGSAASLHAAPIITITSSTSGSRVDLSTLTIDRDGEAGSLASLTYDQSELIGVSVTGYNSENASTVAIPTGASVPAVGSRATLMTDLGLNTGLINLEDAPGAGADPGLRFIFNSPIVNSTGIDVVFIEVQSTTTGSVPDPFWVKVTGGTEKSYSNTNGDYSAKLRDVSFDVYGSGSAINSLADLESVTIATKVTTVTQGIYAVGIDLSDLGVADGATVTSLDFRSGSSSNAVDPVFLAGLPAVPEPAGLSLLGLSALALRRRTRRA